MTLIEINKAIIEDLSKERDSSTYYKNHLQNLFKKCRDYIKNIDDPENLPEGLDKASLDKELLRNTNALLKAYNSYSEGRLSTAITIMRNRFLIEDITTFTIDSTQDWYRARIIEKNGSGFKPKEMFHIPFEKRTEVVNYRFSISGYPCLYLGNTILSCWEEMNCPAPDNLVVSHIKVNSGSTIKVMDLRIPDVSADLSNIEKTSEWKENNLRLLKTWPLIIACSNRRKTSKDPFKYEYIHPQLLMLALREDKGSDIFGVAYTSTHIDQNMSSDTSKYTNIAIPVRMAKDKGYCQILSNIFSVSRGVSFMEANIKNVFDSSNNFHLDPDSGNLYINTYEDGSAPYEKTKFGQMESFLKTMVIQRL